MSQNDAKSMSNAPDRGQVTPVGAATSQALGTQPNSPAKTPAQTELKNLPAAALELTTEIFPGNVSSEVDRDPEWPNDRFWVVTVEVPSSATDLIERRRQWHERVSPLLAGNDVRLSIIRR